MLSENEFITKYNLAEFDINNQKLYLLANLQIMSSWQMFHINQPKKRMKTDKLQAYT